ncbi:FAD-binding oxidoreductase [Bordetella sp. 15P40C-2]|uniref:NAD(P)/FAD-dependent oxidoreductase n=1 Tax=Bordetella sp. 15P40C-2 TaxID=2572246 RepID=UPI00132B7B36|nr:FAD-binding oxidoreductase [Bordetella sp. 15P40C-2]MVW70409.1 FAD-dependent oxidoreductase [Bordetella sp. 15P40C-2]
MTGGKVYDYLIIGAGMAGASLAYRLRDRGSIMVVEMESQAGYHTSGRSAAMFMETYGTPTIRALTRASRAFFEAPPAGFSEHALLADRGVVYIAHEGQESLLAETLEQLQATGATVRLLSADEVVERVPCVRREGLIGAIEEPDAMDIDVHALLQGFLRGAKQSGVEFTYSAAVERAEREGELWHVTLSNGAKVAARSVVDAAGAWGERVAALFGAAPLGLQPKRRSAFTFKLDANDGQWTDTDHWPAVVGVDESFYFKPDAGQFLGSPANADPVEPHDVVAEELDIAIGIDRICTATTLTIRRPKHTWAGLRSFLPDGDFAIGWDPQVSGFFWLVGQGGYGIQSAPGASLLAANLVLGEPLDPSLQAEDIDAALVSPARYHA